MRVPHYALGNIVRIYTVVPFTSIDDAPVDPDIVFLRLWVASKAPVDYAYGGLGAVIRVTTGSYEMPLDTITAPNGPGIYLAQWHGRPDGGSDVTQTGAVSAKLEFVVDNP